MRTTPVKASFMTTTNPSTMTTRWPEPRSQGDDIDDSVDLVNQFESYCQDVFMYTLKNPTAVAPARYVMDMLFQANKIIKLSKGAASTITAHQNDTVESDGELSETDTLKDHGDENASVQEDSTSEQRFMDLELPREDSDGDWNPYDSEEEANGDCYDYDYDEDSDAETIEKEIMQLA